MNKKNEKITFEKEKVSVMQKISKELLNDIEMVVGQAGDDFANETLTAKLTGTIYANMAEERDLIYEFDRPSFLDWFFRRKRKAKFNLKVKDLLLNAPKTNNSMRVYITYQV